MKIIAHHPKKTGHRWKRSRWVPPHAYHDGAAGLLEVKADRKGPREVRPALLACPGNVVGALREGVPPPKDFLRRAAAQTKRQEEATMEEVRKLTAQFADWNQSKSGLSSFPSPVATAPGSVTACSDRT